MAKKSLAVTAADSLAALGSEGQTEIATYAGDLILLLDNFIQTDGVRLEMLTQCDFFKWQT